MNNEDFYGDNNIDSEGKSTQDANASFENSHNDTSQQDNNAYSGYSNQNTENSYYSNNSQYNNTPNLNNGGYNYNSSSNQEPNGPDKNKWKKIVAGVAIAASIALVGGVGFYSVGKIASQLNSGSSQSTDLASGEEDASADDIEETQETTLETTDSAEVTADSAASVAENAMPAIVAITTTSTETATDYFGRTYSSESTGSGSGIIIGQNSSEVLIVTNNHVITGTDVDVEITFCDETTATGTVKGADSSADLAVVAVKFADISDDTKNQIKVISVGDSDSTKVGEVAIAIGNALGYGQSVTVGHVSALNREIAVEDSSMTLMQTDAAINPGNSGGALLNAQGQLIGINSAKTATTEVEGMGYAIPISDALPIIQELMEGNSTSSSDSAYLGVVGQNITSSNALRFNIPEGVYVTEIAENSPAAQAGIQTGMVIVGLDGKEIKTTDDLTEVISTLSAGDQVTINVAVNQNGAYVTKELTVTMGSKSDYESDDSSSSGKSSDGSDGYSYGNDSSDPFSYFSE